MTSVMAMDNLFSSPPHVEFAVRTLDFDPRGDVVLKLVGRPVQLHQKISPDPTSAEILRLLVRYNPRFKCTDEPSSDSTVHHGDRTPPDQPVHMRVSSRHLALASPVFAAMLDKDKFREGTTLQSSGSVQIQLPDDDVNAFIILMNIVHGRPRLVPWQLPSLSLLVRVAVLVDKYHMLEVVELFGYHWLEAERPYLPGEDVRYGQSTSKSNCMSWLFIAWVFEKEGLFAAVTEEMIRGASDELLEHDPDIDPPVPDHVLDAIRQRRIEAIDNLLSVMDNMIKRYLGSERQCPTPEKSRVYNDCNNACDAMLLGSLVKACAKIGIWPRPQQPFRDITFVGLAEQITTAVMDLKSQCDGKLKGWTYPHACHGVREEICDVVGSMLEHGCRADEKLRVHGLELRDFKKLGNRPFFDKE